MVPAAAVPLLVAYATLAAPDEPPVRSTVTVRVPVLWLTVYVEADKASAPTAGAAAPEIVTVALPGLAMLAPALGLERATVNVLFPVNGVASLTGIAKDFGEVSPLAHFRVPVLPVKAVPAGAVPLEVEYATLAAPEEPSMRSTLMVTLAAVCGTE